MKFHWNNQTKQAGCLRLDYTTLKYSISKNTQQYRSKTWSNKALMVQGTSYIKQTTNYALHPDFRIFLSIWLLSPWWSCTADSLDGHLHDAVGLLSGSSQYAEINIHRYPPPPPPETNNLAIAPHLQKRNFRRSNGRPPPPETQNFGRHPPPPERKLLWDPPPPE